MGLGAARRAVVIWSGPVVTASAPSAPATIAAPPLDGSLTAYLRPGRMIRPLAGLVAAGRSGQEHDRAASDAGGHRGAGSGDGADGGGGLAAANISAFFRAAAPIESSSVTTDQNGAALISWRNPASAN